MGFWQYFWEYNKMRNLIILTYGTSVLLLIWQLNNFSKIVFYGPDFTTKAIFLFLFLVCLWMMGELVFSAEEWNDLAFVACIFVIFFALLSAVIAQDSNIIVGGATIILVIVTAYNVMKTDEIAEKQRSIQIEPIVILYPKENDTDFHIIDLIIENVGMGHAKNVQFKKIIPNNFITLSGDPIGKLKFFRNPIQILASKQKYVVHLTKLSQKSREFEFKGLSNDEFNKKIKEALQLQFDISYEDLTGREKLDKFNIDLCIFWGLRYPITKTWSLYQSECGAATMDHNFEE